MGNFLYVVAIMSLDGQWSADNRCPWKIVHVRYKTRYFYLIWVSILSFNQDKINFNY